MPLHLIVFIILISANTIFALPNDYHTLDEQEFKKQLHEIAANFVRDFLEPHQSNNGKKSYQDYIKYGQNEKLVQTLINALKDNNWQVRVFSAYVLGEAKEQRSKQALKEVALNDQYVVVRGMATISLGKMGDDEAKYQGILNLENVLQSKESIEIFLPDKAMAAQMIGLIGDNRAIPALLYSLENNNEFVQEFILSALDEIGDKVAAPTIIKFLKSESPYVREAALRALGHIGNDQCLSSINELLLSDSLLSVREVALCALGNIGSKNAITILINFIEDKDNNIYLRSVAVKIVCRSSDSRIDQVLLKILSK